MAGRPAPTGPSAKLPPATEYSADRALLSSSEFTWCKYGKIILQEGSAKRQIVIKMLQAVMKFQVLMLLGNHVAKLYAGVALGIFCTKPQRSCSSRGALPYNWQQVWSQSHSTCTSPNTKIKFNFGPPSTRVREYLDVQICNRGGLLAACRWCQDSSLKSSPPGLWSVETTGHDHACANLRRV